MTRRALVVLALAFVGTMPAGADDKAAAKKPCGVWKKTAGDNTLTLDIKPDSLKFTLAIGDNTIETEADYSVTKDGVLFGRLNKVAKKGAGDGPEEGALFSFRFTVDKDTLTLSDLKSTAESAEAKELVQGEYKKQ